LLRVIVCLVASLLIGRAELLPHLHFVLNNTFLSALLENLIKAVCIIVTLLAIRRIRSASSLVLPNRFLQAYLTDGITLALALLVASAYLAHFCFEREQREWKCRLSPGQAIFRAVGYKRPPQSQWTLLIVDSEDANNCGALAKSTITINGKTLLGPVFNPGKLIETWVDLDENQAQFGSLLAKHPSALRQWRALVIPHDDGWLKENELNEISIKANIPITIFGCYPKLSGKPANIPAIDYFSGGKMLNEQENGDGRLVMADPTYQSREAKCWRQDVDSSSIIEGDLSSDLGRQTGSYKVYIVSGSESFWQRKSAAKGFIEVF
jgi:hypothetical protein